MNTARNLLPDSMGGGRNRPRKIVLHSMGEFIHHPETDSQPARDLSARAHLFVLGLSAHALVHPSGVVEILREPDRVAWHAGNHNPGSLGVEFLVPGVYSGLPPFYDRIDRPGWVTDAAFQAGVELVRGWAEQYNIPRSEVFEHSAIDPERKRDPGRGFPLQRFLDVVYEVSL